MCMCPMYRWRFDELFINVQYCGVLNVVQVGYGLGKKNRDAPINRPVIRIGLISCMIGPDRWPASQSHVLPIPSRSFYCQRRRQRRHSQVHTHSIISQSHVSTLYSRENNSNVNSFQLSNSNFNGHSVQTATDNVLCRVRWGLHSLSECVRETPHTK